MPHHGQNRLSVNLLLRHAKVDCGEPVISATENFSTTTTATPTTGESNIIAGSAKAGKLII